MKGYLQKILYYTKDKNFYNRLLLLKLGCVLITALLLALIPARYPEAATGLKIYSYETKKNSTYTGTIPKVTLNGEVIGNKYTPGILVNNIALVPYNDIFEKSSIDADCVYNKDKGTVSIAKNGITIQMTIGSKKAKVNGKSVTLPAAPMKIKYRDVELAKVLVPSRFVTETLGLGYSWNKNTSVIAIEKDSFKLSYNGAKAFDYTGTKGKVTLDGSSIDLGNMPSIITNNTAMLRAKRVFADSKIKASYKFNSKDNTVTLTKGDNKLVMTIGSKTAYLNGKSFKLDTAPLIVKNYDVNTSYVMVPGSITASSLGYDYTWNKDKLTSVITTRKEGTSEGKDNSPVDNTNPIPAPELGDNGVINETGTILHQWNSIASLIGQSSNVHSVDQDAIPTGETGMIHTVARDNMIPQQNAETFMLISSVPVESVTSSVKDRVLAVLVPNTNSYDQTYQMYGVNSNYVDTINIVNSDKDISTTVNFNLLTDDFTYDISLSQDKTIIYVTVYVKSLLAASVSTNDSGDYLVMTGSSSLEVEIREDQEFIYVNLPYTANGLGDVFQQLSGTKYINHLFTIATPGMTQIILGMKQGYQYYISDEGNKFTVSFLAQNAVNQPNLPNIPGKPGNQSEYEILIPRPNGLTASMLSDEDDYFNNRFTIRLEGDYSSFFRSNPVISNYNLIKNISVSYKNGYTDILVSTSKLQGYTLALDNDYIYINVGNPRDIYKNIVVLDPGHGGPATGAQHYGAKEKDLNYKILYTIGRTYFNSDPTKLKVYYTRTKDVDMSLKDRAAFAKKVGADLFVSLHMNAVTSNTSKVYGTEVYYSTSNNSPNGSGLTSSKLATLMVNNISGRLGTNRRGAKSARYTVVHNNTVPAVLIELGFMTNKDDFAKLTNGEFQKNAAKVIYETILEVFDAYPTGR